MVTKTASRVLDDLTLLSIAERSKNSAANNSADLLLSDIGIGYVRLHDARHSCATLMHLRGTPIAVIAAWLGHASAAFTMATYAHSQDEALRAAASSFGQL